MRHHCTPPDPDPIAYSLLRFSSPEQSKGDSRRRQTADAEAWCQPPGVPLDPSWWLSAPAVSVYTPKHRTTPARYALAAFLKQIEGRRVRPGDYLLIETLDRLSREEEVPACHLLTGILMSGV